MNRSRDGTELAPRSHGTLVVRADASAAIGAGHVMRCLALSQAWVDAGGRVLLLSATLPARLHARVASDGVEVVAVPDRPGSAEDAGALAGLAADVRAEWVAIDGYHFDAQYEAAARGGGAPVLALEDDGRVSRHAADAVLNQNLHADAQEVAGRAPHARVLVGPRYALLRRDVRAARAASRPTPARAERLLVTMGGSDVSGAAAGILAALSRLRRPPGETRVLVGGAGADDPTLDQLAAAAPARTTVHRDPSDAAAHFAWADLAVTAGGSTCWELAYLGVPSVVVSVAPNQEPIARSLHDADVAHHVGPFGSDTPHRVRAAVAALAADPGARAVMAARGRALVDGRGAGRVVAALRTRALATA